MGQPSDFGKLLVVLGVALTLAGLVLWSGVGRNWLGRLPGDVHYQKGNFSFYFPLVTCIVISLVLSFLLWLFRR